VVLDGTLPLAGDNQDILDSRVHTLLNHILDGGGVNDGKHFLGLRLGGGKETGAETGGRNHCFFDHGLDYIGFNHLGVQVPEAYNQFVKGVVVVVHSDDGSSGAGEFGRSSAGTSHADQFQVGL